MKPVPAKRDAFGRQMWAFLDGGPAAEIVERDDGFVSLSPGNTSYFADFRRWSALERRAIRFARGRTALDVGCGAGRVALHLQSRGFHVIAIDNSPMAVKTAKARGVTDARLLPFENIRQLRPDSLDTVVMFGNNFGLFGSAAKAKRLLKQLHSITRDRAVLIVESRDPYKTNEPAHLAYQRRNRRRGRMPGQIRIRIRFNDVIGPWFDYLLVSPSEMSGIVDGTGWEVDRFFMSDGGNFAALIRRV